MKGRSDSHVPLMPLPRPSSPIEPYDTLVYGGAVQAAGTAVQVLSEAAHRCSVSR